MRYCILNIVQGLSAVAVAIMAFTSCAKVEAQTAETLPEYTLSIQTEAVELKTGMEPSSSAGVYTPVWVCGDKMQIYIDEVSSEEDKKYTLLNQISGEQADFTGTVGAQEGSHTVYGFYPASALVAEREDGVVSIDVPCLQNPELSSFDPTCDVLAAQPMSVTFVQGQSASVNNACFARQLAILKIVPVDATTGGQLAADKVLIVRMSSGTTLAGRAYLDLQNSEITGWTSQSARDYVLAEYSASDDFCINGSNGAFVLVAPGSLSSGSTLEFGVSTDQHLASKSVNLTSDISLPAGKITTLKVKMNDDCVQSAGASLPFSEDFASIKTGNSTSTEGSSTQWIGNSNFPVTVKAYQAGGAVRLGTASAAGSIKTAALNLSGAFTLSFKVKGWTSVEGDVIVTAGSQSTTVTYSSRMSDSFESVVLPFYAESALSNVTIATSKGRCFIDDVSIVAGKTKEHAIVSVDQVTLVPEAEGSVSFTVTSDYAWTASAGSGALFGFSPAGGGEGRTTMTVTPKSANTGYSIRSCGNITISDGSVSKTVAVYQSGIPEPSAKGWAELPTVTSGSTLEFCKHSTLPSNVKLRNYSFLFDRKRHCSLWVAWPLHSCYLGNSGRDNSFDYDPMVSVDYQANITNGAYYPWGGGTASHSRGHQMPSAERTASEADNETSFYATNMTPQLQNFNGAIWKSLETMERESFICPDTLYIVTGPYFGSSPDSAYDNRGKGKLCPVPDGYWKVFLRTKAGNTGKKVSACSADELKCVGFWFDHVARSGKPEASDMRSVSEIEALTGFTFFPNVPNAPKDSYSASDWGL